MAGTMIRIEELTKRSGGALEARERDLRIDKAPRLVLFVSGTELVGHFGAPLLI